MKMNASNSPNSIEEPLFTYYSELGTVSKGTLYDEPDGFYVYSLPSQDLLYDSFDSIQGQIHSRLIDLDNLIIERLFGNQSAYYSIICFCPTAISQVKHHFLLREQIVAARHLGEAGEARGHHGAIMPAVDTLLELCAECRAVRTGAD